MEPLQIAFIGAGDISLLHARAVEACSGAELAGLWDISESTSADKGYLFNCKTYESAESLVNDPAIDAVFVLTPLETHHFYTLMALEAGKHVFVEKPVGINVEEITAMQRLAEAKNLVCMPGHNYVYEASIRRAKELIDGGKLGDLVSIYVLYNIHHPEEVAARYPGVVRQILTHHAYILLFLAGNPVSLTAMKSVVHYEELTVEDVAMVTLQMQSGALAHFCASFAADDHAGDPWTMMVKVIGTKGATRFSYRDWVENTPAVVHSQTYSAYDYSIANIGRFFLDNSLRAGEKPLSSLEDAVTAQKIIEAIEISVAEHRHVAIGNPMQKMN